MRRHATVTPGVALRRNARREGGVVGTNRLIRSYLCAPLIRDGEIVGVLEVDSDRPNAFEAGHVALVERTARKIARTAAVRRARQALAG